MMSLDEDKTMILAAVLTSVLFQQPAVVGPPTPPVVRLESRRGGFGMGDEVEISFYLQSASQGDAAWLVHLKRDYRSVPGQVEQLDRWIDGGSCPAIALAADALRDFRTPKAYGPGDPGGALMAPHGTSYVLTTVGVANGGQTTTVTTDRTGLVLGELAETALGQLRSCF